MGSGVLVMVKSYFRESLTIDAALTVNCKILWYLVVLLPPQGLENQYLFGISLICAAFAWMLSRTALYKNPIRTEQLALLLLFTAALLVRLFIIQADPFLHNWDERYHALVASNMISHPFQPMLRKDPVLPYDPAEWTGNHIWLHKQPFFLWMMALSMKIFGINEVAARLPSALLGALLTLVIWRMGKLVFSKEAAWIAALLFAFCNFQLDQTSGVIGMDHNDVCFTFFITLSVWSFLEYERSHLKKWIWLTGLFSGLAIMNKWLPGLMIFAVWGIRILQSDQFRLRKYPWKQIVAPLAICLITFIPWQIYIHLRFPVESNIESQYNNAHLFTSVENHSGNYAYYLNAFQSYFSNWLILPFVIGVTWILVNKEGRKAQPVLFAIAIMYIFFTFIVATKMISYTFCVGPLVILIIGAGVAYAWEIMMQWRIKKIYGEMVLGIVMILCVFSILQFTLLSATHKRNGSKYEFENRSNKIENTNAYRSMRTLPADYDIIFNCKAMEETEAMFYYRKNVYAYFPDSTSMDSLLHCGYKIAAFSKTENQQLPGYIIHNKKIDKLEIQLR